MQIVNLKKNEQRSPNYFLVRVCLLLFIQFFASVLVYAQDTTSADGLFEYARRTAFDQKDHPNAIRLGRKALAIAPAYTDILIFVGRVYAWTDNMDSSRVYLSKALATDPKNLDGYMAYIDLDVWTNRNDSAIDIIDKGLVVFPASEQLLLLKAKVLIAMHKYSEASPITDSLLKINSNNAEARVLDLMVRDLSSKNKLLVTTGFVHFDKQFPDDWHFTSIEYTRNTPIGPLLARVNYGDRFKTSAFQFEVDVYPRLSKTFYLYLNSGYSDETIVFPKWRGAASLYANLPHTFEAELGIRYLYYSTDIFFYTATLGKYYRKFFFGINEYVTPTPGSYANTSGAFIRYYYGGSDDYINIAAARGVFVDARWYDLNVYRNTGYPSYLGELMMQKTIRKLNIISIDVSMYQQEYFSGSIGNQYQASVGYARRF